MHKLGELGRAHLALVRFLSRVESQVGLEIAGAAKSLVANLAFMWLLSRVYQVVFLQVGELSEALVASLAFERPLSAVHSKVDLEVGELPERLGAHVALVLDLAVLLLEGVGQGLVAGHVSFAFHEIHGFVAAGGRQRR